jgi:hypothetical protein
MSKKLDTQVKNALARHQGDHRRLATHTPTKEQMRARIASQAPEVLHRVILYGCGHLAQIVFHALELSEVKILGICDDNIETIGSDFCGRQVRSASQIRYLAPEAVIVADLERTEEICRCLVSLSDQGINVIRLDCPTAPELSENKKYDSMPIDSLNGTDIEEKSIPLHVSGHTQN